MNKAHTLILLLLIILLSACAPTESAELSGFIEPDPADYVDVMPAVWEYFHHRKSAVITGEMSSFYKRYPALQSGTDLAKGINTEASFVESMRGLEPFDGDIHPEYYERVRVKRSGDELQVLVHGLELYLWKNSEGEFDRSGGEFKLVLFLGQAGERWDLYRTDEVTLAEWRAFEE